MMGLTKNKQLAEDSARNLRCSGVHHARVIEVVAYEIVTDPIIDADHDQRDQLTTRLSLRREK